MIEKEFGHILVLNCWPNAMKLCELRRDQFCSRKTKLWSSLCTLKFLCCLKLCRCTLMGKMGICPCHAPLLTRWRKFLSSWKILLRSLKIRHLWHLSISKSFRDGTGGTEPNRREPFKSTCQSLGRQAGFRLSSGKSHFSHSTAECCNRAEK